MAETSEKKAKPKKIKQQTTEVKQSTSTLSTYESNTPSESGILISIALLFSMMTLVFPKKAFRLAKWILSSKPNNPNPNYYRNSNSYSGNTSYKPFGKWDKRWQKLRYKTLKAHGRKCQCCGATNVELHVDHIKPKSKYPDLAYEFDNLQVLCRDCNLGKSNEFEDDFRKKKYS